MEDTSISVVHLIWLPYGIEYFKGFIESYLTFSSGHKHQLILLFNGIVDQEEATEHHKYINDAGIIYQSYFYKKGFDLEVYRWIAAQTPSEYILFLNSYSRFRSNDWLLKYIRASKNEDVGLIGATGSWQSYYSTVFTKNSWQWTKSSTIKENIKKYKLMLKALFLWHIYFKPFPNPHIRTNAFFIRTNTFLNIRYQNPITKLDAYRIESGRKSITKQVLSMGLKVFLVDKYGNIFEPTLWSNAKLFWNANQANLLISDNQTELYANSDVKTKKLLEKLAWGK